MFLITRLHICTLALITVALSGIAHAECDQAGDPTGYFEGIATSNQAGKLEVSLNLRCVKGHYDGELVTPVGAYSVEAGSFVGNHLDLQLTAGGDHVNIDAQLDAGVLTGTFQAGDDTGQIQLRRLGEARRPGSSVPTLDLSKEQWHEDLRFYSTQLPKRHIDAFHHIRREQFESEVAALDRRIEQLDGDGVFVGLVRIAALIGDGHTHFEPPEDIANFPIDVRRFGNEYRVVAVGAGTVQRALGARIVKIDQTPFPQARDLLLSLTPQDENSNLGLARIEQTVTEGLYLHGLGIIPDRRAAHYTLADQNGKQFTIELHSVSMAESMSMQWVYAAKEQPLYRQEPGDVFWSKYLPESHTVYCNFRGYNEIEKNAGVLLNLIKTHRPDKLVIDLRQNGGGDYTLGQKFVIDPIRGLPGLNKRGHLFVLIGPYTFSAGMANAAQFRSETLAILVGEPIGEKPNSFQEAREMRLPNSHLLARYSTQKYSFAKKGDNVIRPDKQIDREWNSYQAGQDPVLEWVLSYADR